MVYVFATTKPYTKSVRLIANQIRGTHNFPQLMYLGVDWFYSDARSNRYAPGNVSTRFILFDANNDGQFDLQNESSLRRGTTASRYTFQDLNDDVENFGLNVSLPLTWGTQRDRIKKLVVTVLKKLVMRMLEELM